MEKASAMEMIKFLDEGKTPFHAVEVSVDMLKEAGFIELLPSEKWNIEKGNGYYLNYKSAIMAFKVYSEDGGYHIIGSHTDSPSIMIKPNPVIKENGYVKLNSEIYGGPILNTWLDRPLSIAGKVILKSDNIMNPKEVLVDFEKAVAIIPNLAIHLNREVNKGVELNKQKDMIPLVSLSGDYIGDDYLVKMLSDKIGEDTDNIIDYELYLYEVSKSSFVGFNDEFISAPRVDNLAMLHASLKALIESKEGTGVKFVAGFDNEEVGSMSKTGADSTILSDTLERIAISLGLGREEHLMNMDKSFMISSDMAHAIHPNTPEKHDPTNKPKINEGPVIKISSNKRYTSDSQSSAVFAGLCQDVSVPYQKFVNRSDEVGGSTIGPISSSHVSIKSVDIGNPMLSMHSIRELVGTMDHHYITKVFARFFTI